VKTFNSQNVLKARGLARIILVVNSRLWPELQIRYYRLTIRQLIFLCGATLLAGSHALSQRASTSTSEDPEAFRGELTGSTWILKSGGTIQSGGAPIDLVNDLGVEQNKPTFYGQLVFNRAGGIASS
jgi:hypothetical protein